MDYSDIFRIVNLAVGVFIILGGIGNLYDSHGPPTIVMSIYFFIFGAGTCLLEFQIPPVFARYASFMFSFLGRGLFYLFLASIILSTDWYKIIPGAIIGLVGIGYAVLEYTPSIEPPANMR